jgi:CRISPR/Cas system-associated endonuclease Cas1
MTLYLDSFQAALRAKDKTFVVASPNNSDKTFAPAEIKTIFLTKGVSVTTDALLLAIAHDIPVVLLNSIRQYQHNSAATSPMEPHARRTDMGKKRSDYTKNRSATTAFANLTAKNRA